MSIEIRYKLQNTVDAYESAAGVALVSATSGKALALGPEMIPMVGALQSDRLTEDEAVEKTDNLSWGYFTLIRMAEAGMLESRIIGNGNILLSVSPSPAESAFRNTIEPGETYRLNRFAYLRRDEEQLLLESPLTLSRVSIHDGKFIGIMHSLCSGLCLDIAGDEIKIFLSALIALHIVEPAKAAGENDPMEFWEFHDLLYSARTLGGRNAYPLGGTYRFHGRCPPVPAARASISDDTIDLPRSSGDPAGEPTDNPTNRLNRPFGTVLNERRSIREYADAPLTLEELGTFLHASAEVNEVIEDPEHNDIIFRRPSPSGGARHALEIYPLIRQCGGVEPGAYRYDAVNHRLEQVPMAKAIRERLLEDNPYEFLGNGPPQVTLNISARIGRTAWKYESIAYKLINQDLGCLYQTFYLVAAALGLAPCALGSVDADRLGRAHGIDLHEEPFIGVFTLGK